MNITSSKFTLCLYTSAVPPDWFSNPGSLKESFRIASSLDWANIDLSGHPGLFCCPESCLIGYFTQNYKTFGVLSNLFYIPVC